MSIPQTDETDPTEAVIDILENVQSTVWTIDEPNVYRQWDVPFSERGPGQNQRAEIYVWSPVGGDIEEFDAEGSETFDTGQVEISIWTLDAAETIQYQNNVITIMQGYMRDNYENSEFHQIKPTSKEDLRREKPARKTDYFVTTVTLDHQDLSETGL